MNDKKNIDELLQQGLVRVPDSFSDDVLLQVAAYERYRLNVVGATVVNVEVAPMTWWQVAALIAASVWGIGQVLRFVFAVWLVTAAI